jgi:hypothetical protein
MKSIRDKGKLIIDEGGPSQTSLTFVIEPEKNLRKNCTCVSAKKKDS